MAVHNFGSGAQSLDEQEKENLRVKKGSGKPSIATAWKFPEIIYRTQGLSV